MDTTTATTATTATATTAQAMDEVRAKAFLLAYGEDGMDDGEAYAFEAFALELDECYEMLSEHLESDQRTRLRTLVSRAKLAQAMVWMMTRREQAAVDRAALELEKRATGDEVAIAKLRERAVLLELEQKEARAKLRAFAAILGPVGDILEREEHECTEVVHHVEHELTRLGREVPS